MFVRRWGNLIDDTSYSNYMYDDKYTMEINKYKISSDNIILSRISNYYNEITFEIDESKYDNNLSNKELYGLNGWCMSSYEFGVENKCINLPKVIINLLGIVKLIDYKTRTELAVEFIYLDNTSKNIITTDSDFIKQKIDEIINQIIDKIGDK